MSAIGPGDWVECVDVSPSKKGLGECPLILHALYVVEHVTRSDHPLDRNDPWGILLVGVPMPRNTLAWPLDRFRPIYRPKQELIESLKTPVRAKAPA